MKHILVNRQEHKIILINFKMIISFLHFSHSGISLEGKQERDLLQDLIVVRFPYMF